MNWNEQVATSQLALMNLHHVHLLLAKELHCNAQNMEMRLGLHRDTEIKAQAALWEHGLLLC